MTADSAADMGPEVEVLEETELEPEAVISDAEASPEPDAASGDEDDETEDVVSDGDLRALMEAAVEGSDSEAADAADEEVEHVEVGATLAAEPSGPAVAAASASAAPAGAAAAASASAAPAEPAARAGAVGVVRDPVELVVQYPPYGSIRFNKKLQILVAHCACRERHGAHCKKQRTLAPGRGGQGRPLGLLAAWLRDGPNQESQYMHSHWSVPGLTLAKRQAARQDFLASCGAPAAELASKERPKVGHEGSEPENID